jgi:cytochrome c biogenesis protein CcmG/thiol:disulfide interchange protein DsbE
MTPDAPERRGIARPAAIAVALVLAGLVWVLATSDNDDGVSPLVGQAAPELDGRGLTGTDFASADARGQFVLVNFFATWCVPCRDEHPELVRFAAQHPEAQVVSVVFRDEEEDVRDFFDERGGEWPVLRDPEGRVALDYGVTGIPESFLVNPDGVVVSKITGGVSAGALDALLREAEAGA